MEHCTNRLEGSTRARGLEGRLDGLLLLRVAYDGGGIPAAANVGMGIEEDPV